MMKSPLHAHDKSRPLAPFTLSAVEDEEAAAPDSVPDEAGCVELPDVAAPGGSSVGPVAVGGRAEPDAEFVVRKVDEDIDSASCGVVASVDIWEID